MKEKIGFSSAIKMRNKSKNGYTTWCMSIDKALAEQLLKENPKNEYYITLEEL